jgi:hypothetical protein
MSDTMDQDVKIVHDVGEVTKGNGTPVVVETKEQKFRRLANMRVPAALKRIRHVANLANKNFYSYTDDQADKVILALREAFSELIRAFEQKSGKEATWSL